MKTAFCLTGPGQHKEEYEKRIKYIGELGYDGIELWDQLLKVVDVNKLKEIIDSTSLSVAQICPYFDFTGSIEKYHESLKIADKYVELAKILDTKLIRVFTGKVSSKEATKDIWQQAVKGLREMCLKGKDDGIFFAFETHNGNLTDSTSSILRLLDEVGCPNLKVNLQVPLGHEDIYEIAEKIGKHTIHIHAHNWIGRSPDGDWKQLTYLDDDKGEVDFARYTDILHKHGFNGYISIEHAGHQGRDDPNEAAKHEIAYLRNLVSKYK